MKLKFLSGGTFVPPYVVYLPHILPDYLEEAATKGSKSAKSEDTGMKDLYKLLEGLNGLPGDVSAASVALEQLFNSVHKKINDPRYMSGTQSIASEYLKINNLISNIKYQAELFEKARDTAIEKGSIHEFAIDATGRVGVETSDGLEWVSPEEYFSNPEEYRPITNLELLNYREQGAAGLTFNSRAILTVANGMSMDEITDSINKAMDKLGKSEESAEGALLMRSLHSYIKASDSVGSFKVEDIKDAKLLTENLLDLAQLAFNYIIRQLSPTAKTLLKMKSGGTDEGLLNMVKSLVYSKVSGKTNLDLLSKEKRALGSNDIGSMVEANPVTAFLSGMTTEKIKINIGRSVPFDITASVGLLTSDSFNTVLGAGNVLKDVQTGDLGTILDFENATFGGAKLDMNTVGFKFILDTNKITSMDLPIDEEAHSDGIIKPDFDLQRRIEEAEEEIAIKKPTTQEEINEIYQRHQLPAKFKDANGNYNLALVPMGRFARITGAVDERGLPKDAEVDNTVVKIEDENTKEAIIETFKTKNKKYDIDSSLFEEGTKFYKGAVYIPMKESYVQGLTGYKGAGLNMDLLKVIRQTEYKTQLSNELKIKEQTYSGPVGLSGKK